MSIRGYEKWDNYKIGSIKWINSRRGHPHRKLFVDQSKHAASILEIGPGEMIEYQQIKLENPDVKYAIVDVSDLFIEHCQFTFPEVDAFKMQMEDISEESVGRYEVVYVASVLEHSKDVKAAIQRLISVSDNFHFVLFKWRYDGGLTSDYNKKKKYWSTSFNIHMLLDEISKWGHVSSCDVVSQEGNVIDFLEFSKGKSGECRTGDYLVIRGGSNEDNHSDC